MNVTRFLGLDQTECFTRSYHLYDDGGYIKLYNQRMTAKCDNAVLPFFAYSAINANLLDPVDTFGFCDNINDRIQAGYNQRQDYVNGQVSDAQTVVNNYEDQIANLNKIGDHLPVIIDGLTDVQLTWGYIYHNMTSARSKEITSTSVTIYTKQNIELLNQTIADWVMQGRKSLTYVRGSIPPDDSLLNYEDPLIANFEKIELLDDHIVQYTTYIDQLVIFSLMKFIHLAP
jgi:hypothetical protein